MKKIKSKIKFIIILLIFSTHASTHAKSFDFKTRYLYLYTQKSDKIKISELQFERLSNYLNGNFFSFEQNNFQKNVRGIYFSISETGNASVLSYCDDNVVYCVTNNLKFRTNYKCERISKERCFIILVQDNIVLNKKKSHLIGELSKYKKTIFLIHKGNSKQIMSDIRAELYRDRESNDYE